MKEYRIICDCRSVHADGRENAYAGVSVWVGSHGLPRHTIYKTKAEANKALAKTVRMAREFDAKSQERAATGDPDVIAYYQTNIRIQSRNVTEWKD